MYKIMNTMRKAMALALALGLSGLWNLNAGEEEGTTETRAFLGVYVETVPELVSEQLGLDPGVGVVVEGLVKGGAAEEAGLQKHDILLKYDDQILIGTKQIVVLVRNSEIGSEHKVTLLRKGKEFVVPVSIGSKKVKEEKEKKEHGMIFAPESLLSPDAPVAPGSAVFAVKTLEHIKNADTNAFFMDEDMTRRMEMNEEFETLIERVQMATEQMEGVDMPTLVFQGPEQVFEFKDDSGVRYIILNEDGHRALTVINEKGETVFEDVLNDEAKKLLPDVLIERLPQIERVVETRVTAPSWVSSKEQYESF